MANLEAKLDEVKKQIAERNSNRRIKCESCDKSHAIGTLKAIQTYFYVEPHGCIGGDYWLPGELQYICPTNGIINRLLFDIRDVLEEQRMKNPARQFRNNYVNLFKEVVETYSEKTMEQWVNNYYVDNNRKKFSLVEKRK